MKGKPEKKPVEIAVVGKDLTMGYIQKPVAVEIAQKAAVKRDIDSLNRMTTELEEKRQFSTIESRLKDLQYVEKLEEFLDVIVDALTADKPALHASIVKMIQEGQIAKVQSLLTSVGIAMDKRTAALEVFDDARADAKSKKKVKLNLIWKKDENGAMGVQAEVSGG